MNKCPRCRTDWIGTPTEDGRRKCRNCGVVWRVTDGVRRITFDPRKAPLRMNATEADHIAADRLMGVSGSHSRMEGLPGADKCHHILAGSGIPVVDTNGGYSREYSQLPYRHHAFTKRDDDPANVYCVCMNTDKGHNGLHVRCDI